MANNFVMVITSDPQYSWFPENDPESVGLVACEELASGRKEDNKRENKLEHNYYISIKEQFDKLVSDSNPCTPYIAINGDLVAYNNATIGSNDRSMFKKTFYKDYCSLVGEDNVFFGLGNHDYINNNNDTAGNEGAIEMLDFLRATIGGMEKKGLIQSFDCKKGAGVEQYYGSMAYYKVIGNTAFIQLNYGIGNPEKINESINFKCYHLSSAHGWLTQTLNTLEGDSKISSIFINVHNYRNVKDSNKIKNCDTYTTLSNLLSGDHGNKVKAVFGGHYHTAYGKQGECFKNGDRKIPIYLSGSASQGSFITLVGKDDGKFEVAVWRNSNIENTQTANKLSEEILPLCCL